MSPSWNNQESRYSDRRAWDNWRKNCDWTPPRARKNQSQTRQQKNWKWQSEFDAQYATIEAKLDIPSDEAEDEAPRRNPAKEKPCESGGESVGRTDRSQARCRETHQGFTGTEGDTSRSELRVGSYPGCRDQAMQGDRTWWCSTAGEIQTGGHRGIGFEMIKHSYDDER